METWRKSTYSGSNGGQCVEVADTESAVLVRDTTNRDGLALNVPVDAWMTFLATVK